MNGGAKVASLRHPLTRSLLLLTATTGLVDAASYLGLGHVFAANMTGNIVLLGFGIVGGYGLPVIAPLVSLAAFLLGAAAGGRLLRGQEQRRAQFTMALTIEAFLLAAAAVVAAVADVRAGNFAGDCVIALLALGMGVRNATVRKLAVPDLTTTVLTMTLTGLAAESPLAGGNGSGTVRRTSAVVAMLVGALVGALLLKVSLWLVVVVACVSTAVTFLGYRRTADDSPSTSTTF
ncbi:MAG TPA: YoaK family protein [Baekduia sp.]|nr:YoaK family protein [Baekduia sp.]